MVDRRDTAAELRELCVSLAVQTGASEAAKIISLAETLRIYIETGNASDPGEEERKMGAPSTFRTVRK